MEESMTRELYEKDKAAKIAAGKMVIDLTQPRTALPSMFREEVSAYEITNESLWKNPRGQTVGFGGVWDAQARDHVNKATILTPAFTQLVATGAGVTAAGEPEIEKHFSTFLIVFPSGRTVEMKYVSRVVGRIAFKKLTPSGNPEIKYYTTEVDVDALLNKAIVDDMEKVGTYDKYEKGPDGKPLLWTEENIRYASTNESKNSQNKFKKLTELGQFAYQKVDTKLRSHGQEKFIGIPNVTENMIGATIYVSRISYNTDDPKIAQALAIGAVQDILGMKAPARLIENTTTLEDAPDEAVNVTTEPLDDSDDFDSTDVTETIPNEETVVETATAAAETTVSDEGCLKIIEWTSSDMIQDSCLLKYLDAVAYAGYGTLVTAPILAGLTLLSKGNENEEAAYKLILASAKEVYSGNAEVVAFIESVVKKYDITMAHGIFSKTTKKITG